MLHRAINDASSYSLCFSEIALTFTAHERYCGSRADGSQKSVFIVCVSPKTWRIAIGGNRVGFCWVTRLLRSSLIGHMSTRSVTIRLKKWPTTSPLALATCHSCTSRGWLKRQNCGPLCKLTSAFGRTGEMQRGECNRGQPTALPHLPMVAVALSECGCARGKQGVWV